MRKRKEEILSETCLLWGLGELFSREHLYKKRLSGLLNELIDVRRRSQYPAQTCAKLRERA